MCLRIDIWLNTLSLSEKKEKFKRKNRQTKTSNKRSKPFGIVFSRIWIATHCVTHFIFFPLIKWDKSTKGKNRVACLRMRKSAYVCIFLINLYQIFTSKAIYGRTSRSNFHSENTRRHLKLKRKCHKITFHELAATYISIKKLKTYFLFQLLPQNVSIYNILYYFYLVLYFFFLYIFDIFIRFHLIYLCWKYIIQELPYWTAYKSCLTKIAWKRWPEWHIRDWGVPQAKLFLNSHKCIS